MRLVNIHAIGNKDYGEHVFSNSTFASLIVFLIFFGLFLTCVGHYVWVGISHPVGFWATLVYLWFAFWFGFIACLGWSRIKAGKLPSNWLLRSSPNRVLIKFRSFQNYNYPDSDPVVLEFFWSEIDWLRMTKETSHKPGSDGDVTEYFTYLDMKLNVSDEELDMIKQGLAKERSLPPLRSKVGELKSELFRARKDKRPKHEIEEIKNRLRYEKTIKQSNKKSSAKYHDYPVRLVDSNILRVRWNSIKPNIKKTLMYLSAFSTVETENKIETDTTGKRSGVAFDDMILDRISKGDKLDAIRLVREHYNYSTTEAKLFVDELMTQKTTD